MNYMKRCCLGATLGFFLLSPASVLAQEQGGKKADSAAAGAHAAPSATAPGEAQAFLAKRAGEYTRVVKFVGQPGAAGMEFQGSAKISVILGGRFVQEENNDIAFGEPVSGMRLYGYNNATKQYEAVWTYTMSTAILMMTGTSSDGGKTVDYAGTTYTAGGGKMPLHATIRQVSDDQFIVTLMSTGADGKESAFQETTYTRKK